MEKTKNIKRYAKGFVSLALTLTLVGCDEQPTNTEIKPQTTTITPQKEPDKLPLHQVISDPKKYSQELEPLIELVPGTTIQPGEYKVSDVVIDKDNETTKPEETKKVETTKIEETKKVETTKIEETKKVETTKPEETKKVETTRRDETTTTHKTTTKQTTTLPVTTKTTTKLTTTKTTTKPQTTTTPTQKINTNYSINDIFNNASAFETLANQLNMELLANYRVELSYGSTYGGRESRVALLILNSGSFDMFTKETLKNVFSSYTEEDFRKGTRFYYSICQIEKITGTDVDYKKYTSDPEIGNYLNQIDMSYRKGTLENMLKSVMIDGNISEKLLNNPAVMGAYASYDMNCSYVDGTMIDDWCMDSFMDTLFNKVYGHSYTK